jgi:arabinofuranosyltransferase
VRDGTRLDRSDAPWLASLLLVGCLTLSLFASSAHRLTEGQGGVPLDDAWIHFQFARNLARGDGLSFNPGQPTSGSTAPLWTLLLAAAYSAGGRFPITGQLMSGVCFLATLMATYALGKRLTGKPWAAWLAGTIVAVNGRTVWAGLSALETCLFGALSLLAITAHLNDRAARRYRLSTAALFGLAALSRPEGYFLFALALADLTMYTVKNEVRATHHAERTKRHSSGLASRASRITRLFSRVLLPAALFAAIVCPYLIFSVRTSGHLLPNTYHAKATVSLLPDREFRDFVSIAARYLILDKPLLLPFFLFGLFLLIERAPLLSLWDVGLPLAYAFLRASLYQHGRYLIPLIPCNAAIGMWGLLEAHRLARRRGWWGWRGSPRALGILVSMLVLSGTAWRLPTMASLYAWNVDNINQMHVALGQWVVDHTPPDATLALNDIGAITYISERPVVDLAGLVTPEVVPLLRAPDRDARLADFMAGRNVQYVIILPNWFPQLAARSDLLKPVHQVILAHNTIAGGDMMVVYRVCW